MRYGRRPEARTFSPVRQRTPGAVPSALPHTAQLPAERGDALTAAAPSADVAATVLAHLSASLGLAVAPRPEVASDEPDLGHPTGASGEQLGQHLSRGQSSQTRSHSQLLTAAGRRRVPAVPMPPSQDWPPHGLSGGSPATSSSSRLSPARTRSASPGRQAGLQQPVRQALLHKVSGKPRGLPGSPVPPHQSSGSARSGPRQPFLASRLQGSSAREGHGPRVHQTPSPTRTPAEDLCHDEESVMLATPAAVRHELSLLPRHVRIAELFSRRAGLEELRCFLVCWRYAVARSMHQRNYEEQSLMVSLARWRGAAKAARCSELRDELAYSARGRAPGSARAEQLKDSWLHYFTVQRASVHLAQVWAAWAGAAAKEGVQKLSKAQAKLRSTATGRAVFRLARAGSRLAQVQSSWLCRTSLALWQAYTLASTADRESGALLASCRAMCAWRQFAAAAGRKASPRRHAASSPSQDAAAAGAQASSPRRPAAQGAGARPLREFSPVRTFGNCSVPLFDAEDGVEPRTAVGHERRRRGDGPASRPTPLGGVAVAADGVLLSKGVGCASDTDVATHENAPGVLSAGSRTRRSPSSRPPSSRASSARRLGRGGVSTGRVSDTSGAPGSGAQAMSGRQRSADSATSSARSLVRPLQPPLSKKKAAPKAVPVLLQRLDALLAQRCEPADAVQQVLSESATSSMDRSEGGATERSDLTGRSARFRFGAVDAHSSPPSASTPAAALSPLTGDWKAVGPGTRLADVYGRPRDFIEQATLTRAMPACRASGFAASYSSGVRHAELALRILHPSCSRIRVSEQQWAG
eukprot:TRINITY_DN16966_c0_g3_i4.p1 TRINITY_DN16966_c0_g3~~TRINITY_DN16966_c0_g3_i4.p1  ORF type:complete len:811 (-),score=146.18 TRINITY_DN16966_c0_g3_i4:213-2645(-)